MGDIICTFPAVRALQKRHPGAAFIYSCLPDFACLPAIGGITRRTTSISFGRTTRWAFLFAKVYHFSYGDERPGETCTETLIEEFCRQHDVPVTNVHPRLEARPAALARARALLAELGLAAGPHVFLHLGPSWPVREWPPASWSQLASELESRGFRNLIRVGVDQHVEMGATSGVEIPKTLSLVNRLSIEETVALISLGALFVGIDSGLLHIAASTRTPAVGLFGATSPQFRFAPSVRRSFVVSDVECQGCHHRLPRLHWQTGCPYEIRCMKTLPVGRVVEACLALLEAQPPQEKSDI